MIAVFLLIAAIYVLLKVLKSILRITRNMWCDSQVLCMSSPSFSRTVSERDWLKNSAKIWEIIKTSPIVADYYKTLHSSGMFRR